MPWPLRWTYFATTSLAELADQREYDQIVDGIKSIKIDEFCRLSWSKEIRLYLFNKEIIYNVFACHLSPTCVCAVFCPWRVDLVFIPVTYKKYGPLYKHIKLTRQDTNGTVLNAALNPTRSLTHKLQKCLAMTGAFCLFIKKNDIYRIS